MVCVCVGVGVGVDVDVCGVGEVGCRGGLLHGTMRQGDRHFGSIRGVNSGQFGSIRVNSGKYVILGSPDVRNFIM